MDNPAKLSVELSRLFPPGALAAEVTVPVSQELLTPAERQHIAHCAPKRIRDFSAGRACARHVLGQLGITDFSLLAGRQREPLWPPSIVGSITHTHGYGAAVAAHQRDLRALGLDCEVISSVDEDLWSRICAPAEVERLSLLPLEEQGRQAALIFAAKEAFYKCQFPLTHQWVGFEDVAVEPLDWPVPAGALRIIPINSLPLDEVSVAGLTCRFQFRDPWVLVGVALSPV